MTQKREKCERVPYPHLPLYIHRWKFLSATNVQTENAFFFSAEIKHRAMTILSTRDSGNRASPRFFCYFLAIKHKRRLRIRPRPSVCDHFRREKTTLVKKEKKERKNEPFTQRNRFTEFSKPHRVSLPEAERLWASAGLQLSIGHWRWNNNRCCTDPLGLRWRIQNKGTRIYVSGKYSEYLRMTDHDGSGSTAFSFRQNVWLNFLVPSSTTFPL